MATSSRLIFINVLIGLSLIGIFPLDLSAQNLSWSEWQGTACNPLVEYRYQPKTKFDFFLNEKPIKHEWMLEIRNVGEKPLSFHAEIIQPDRHPDNAFVIEGSYETVPRLFLPAKDTLSYALYLDEKRAERLAIDLRDLSIERAEGPLPVPCGR